MTTREPVNGSGRKALGWLMTLFGAGTIMVCGAMIAEMRGMKDGLSELTGAFREHVGVASELVPILRRVEGEVRSIHDNLYSIQGRIALIEMRLDRLEKHR